MSTLQQSVTAPSVHVVVCTHKGPVTSWKLCIKGASAKLQQCLADAVLHRLLYESFVLSSALTCVC